MCVKVIKDHHPLAAYFRLFKISLLNSLHLVEQWAKRIQENDSKCFKKPPWKWRILYLHIFLCLELTYMTNTTCKEGWEIRRKHRYVREQFILPEMRSEPFPSIITQDTFTCVRKYIYSSIVAIVKIWKQQKLLLSRWINNLNMTYLWNEILCRVKRNKLNTY